MPAPRRRVASDWVLEALPERAQDGGYLVDPDTGLVFLVRSPTSWPDPVGWLGEANQVERVEIDGRAWAKRVHMAFADGAKVRRVFFSNCSASNANLRLEEVKKVLADMLGESAASAEVMYLTALLGVDRGVVIELKDFLQAGKTAAKIVQAVAVSADNKEVRSTLHQMSIVLARAKEAADELFAVYDVDGDGTLDPLEVLWLCKALLPDLRPVQIKIIVAYLQMKDIHQMAEFQFRDLLQVFRAIPVHMPHGCHPGTFDTPAALSPSSHLKRRRLQSQAGAEGEGDHVSVLIRRPGESGPFDLCRAMLKCLKENMEAFDAAFAHFDADGNGSLDIKELKNFLESIFSSRIQPAEVHSLIAILDLNGDGAISKKELTHAAADLTILQDEMANGMEVGPSINLLDQFVTWVCDQKEEARELFLSLDTKQKGYLLSNGLGEYIQAVLLDANTVDTRRVLANFVRRLQGFETMGSGKVSFGDLMRAARDVKARLVQSRRKSKRAENLGRSSNKAALLGLFRELNNFVETKSSQGFQRFASAFQKFAGPGPDAKLPVTRLQSFMVELVGTARSLDAQYFQAMLMASRLEGISMQDVITCIKDGYSILAKFKSSGSSSDACKLLKTLSVQFQEHEEEARQLFQKADTDKDGTITPLEIVSLIRSFTTDAPRREIQICVACVQEFDEDRNGKISFGELRDGLLSLHRETTGDNGDADDVLQPRENMLKLIEALNRKLQRENVAFKKFFNKYAGEKGSLGMMQLHRLVRECLGYVNMPTLRYFEAMLDINGDGKVSFQELVECITETRNIVAKVSSGKRVETSGQLTKNLSAISARILTHRTLAREIFDQVDKDHDGALEPTELRIFLQRIDPNLRPDELRLLLAHYQSMDADKSGKLDFQEIMAGIAASEFADRPEEAGATYGSSGRQISPRSAGRTATLAMPPPEAQRPDGTVPPAVETGRERSPLTAVQSEASLGQWSPRAAAPPGGPAKLEPLYYDGSLYVVNPKTRVVYSEPLEEESSAETLGAGSLLPVGSLCPDNTIEFRAQPQQSSPEDDSQDAGDANAVSSSSGPTGSRGSGLAQLYTGIDAFLKVNQFRFADMFRAYDSRGTGKLSRADLAGLLDDILGATSLRDVRYFQAMMDTNQDGQVSLPEFIGGLREAREVSLVLGEGLDAAADREAAAIHGISDMLASCMESDLEDGFRKADKNSDGLLQLPEAVALIRELMPMCGARDLRLAVAFLYQLDGNQDASISLPQLQQWFRCFRAGCLQTGTLPPASEPSSLSSTPRLPESPMASRDDTSEIDDADYLDDPLKLVNFEHKGRELLLDPETLDVYEWADLHDSKWADKDQWPERIGRLDESGEIRMLTTRSSSVNKLTELYNNLYQYMREEKLKFNELFNSFSSHGKGKMPIASLQRLLCEILGDISEGDIQQLTTMIDANGDGVVTLAEFKGALREVGEVAEVMRSEHEMATRAERLRILNRLSTELTKNKERAKRLFHHFSRRPVAGGRVRKGCLQHPQAPDLIRELIPGLTAREVRFGIAHLFSLDANGDGLLSYGEFLRALRATKVQLPSGTIPPGFRTTTTPAASGAGSVEAPLEPYHHKGDAYLLDQGSGALYQVNEAAPGPVAVGFVNGQGEVKFTSPTDDGAKKLAAFYRELMSFMQEENLEFKQLFAQYDSSGTGRLLMEDLQRFLDAILGIVSNAEAVYLQAMLDANGDGEVTLAEFAAGLAEVSEIGQQDGRQLGAQREDERNTVLEMLAKALTAKKEEAEQLFFELDSSGAGCLNPVQFAQLIRSLIPGMSERELRYSLVCLSRMDRNGDGLLSYRELILALGGATLRTNSCSPTAPGNTSAAGASDHSEETAPPLVPEPAMQLDAEPAFELSESDLEVSDVHGAGNALVLEPFDHRGQRLLVDPATRLLFSQPQGSATPEQVGRLNQQGQVCLDVTATGGSDRLAQLCQSVQRVAEEEMAFSEKFQRFDSRGHGSLGKADVWRLLEDAMASASPGEVKYLQAMIDADWGGGISESELRAALLEVAAIARDMSDQHRAVTSHAMQQTLCQLSDTLRDSEDEARHLFSQLDGGGKGFLEPFQIGTLIRALVPGLSATELRISISFMHKKDIEGAGRIPWQAFVGMFEALEEAKPRNDSAEVSVDDAPAAPQADKTSEAASVAPQQSEDFNPAGVGIEAEALGQFSDLPEAISDLQATEDLKLALPDTCDNQPPSGSDSEGPVSQPEQQPYLLAANNRGDRDQQVFMPEELPNQESSGTEIASDPGLATDDDVGPEGEEPLPRHAVDHGRPTPEQQVKVVETYTNRPPDLTNGTGPSCLTPNDDGTHRPDMSSTSQETGVREQPTPAQPSLAVSRSGEAPASAADLPARGRHPAREADSVLPQAPRSNMTDPQASDDRSGPGAETKPTALETTPTSATSPEGPGWPKQKQAAEVEVPQSLPLHTERRSASSPRKQRAFAAACAAVEDFLERVPPGEGRAFWLQRVSLKIGSKSESFLLERRTGALYTPANTTGWPQLAGVLRNDKFIRQHKYTPSSNIFSALLRSFSGQRGRHQLRHIFGKYDSNYDGRITHGEMQQVTRDLYAKVAPGELEHLVAMLLLENGGRALSEQELLVALSNCQDVSMAALALQPHRTTAALNQLSEAISSNLRTAWRLFREQLGGEGLMLSQRGLTAFLQSVEPDCRPKDIQLCLAFVQIQDVEFLGSIGFLQLLQTLRCVPLRGPAADGPIPSLGFPADPSDSPTSRGASASAAEPEAAPGGAAQIQIPEKLSLGPIAYQDRQLLHEPATDMVYERSEGDESWPRLVSKLQQGQLHCRPTFGCFYGQMLKLYREQRGPANHVADNKGRRSLDVGAFLEQATGASPEPSARDINCLRAILTLPKEGMSSSELMSFLTDAADIENEAHGHRTSSTPSKVPLHRPSQAIRDQPTRLQQAFNSLSDPSSGRLEFLKLPQLLYETISDLRLSEAMRLLAYCHCMDVAGEGSFSLLQLLLVMRCVPLELPEKPQAAAVPVEPQRPLDTPPSSDSPKPITSKTPSGPVSDPLPAAISTAMETDVGSSTPEAPAEHQPRGPSGDHGQSSPDPTPPVPLLDPERHSPGGASDSQSHAGHAEQLPTALRGQPPDNQPPVAQRLPDPPGLNTSTRTPETAEPVDVDWMREEERLTRASHAIVLEDVLLDGSLMLTDRSSRLVFHQFTEDSYPALVGTLDSGRLNRASIGPGVSGMLRCLERLQDALQDRTEETEDAVASALRTTEGLDPLESLMSTVVPSMLDGHSYDEGLVLRTLLATVPHNYGPLSHATLSEFVSRAVATVSRVVSESATDPFVLQTLGAVSDALRRHHGVAWAMFSRMDPLCSGHLLLHEALEVVRMVAPAASSAELQVAAAFLLSHDTCSSCQVTFQALLMAFRTVLLATEERTFYPCTGFVSAGGAAIGQALDVSLLRQEVDDKLRILLYKQLRAANPRLTAALGGISTGQDGRISYRTLAEIRGATLELGICAGARGGLGRLGGEGPPPAPRVHEATRKAETPPLADPRKAEPRDAPTADGAVQTGEKAEASAGNSPPDDGLWTSEGARQGTEYTEWVARERAKAVHMWRDLQLHKAQQADKAQKQAEADKAQLEAQVRSLEQRLSEARPESTGAAKDPPVPDVQQLAEQMQKTMREIADIVTGEWMKDSPDDLRGPMLQLAESLPRLVEEGDPTEVMGQLRAMWDNEAAAMDDVDKLRMRWAMLKVERQLMQAAQRRSARQAAPPSSSPRRDSPSQAEPSRHHHPAGPERWPVASPAGPATAPAQRSGQEPVPMETPPGMVYFSGPPVAPAEAHHRRGLYPDPPAVPAPAGWLATPSYVRGGPMRPPVITMVPAPLTD